MLQFLNRHHRNKIHRQDRENPNHHQLVVLCRVQGQLLDYDILRVFLHHFLHQQFRFLLLNQHHHRFHHSFLIHYQHYQHVLVWVYMVKQHHQIQNHHHQIQDLVMWEQQHYYLHHLHHHKQLRTRVLDQ